MYRLCLCFCHRYNTWGKFIAFVSIEQISRKRRMYGVTYIYEKIVQTVELYDLHSKIIEIDESFVIYTNTKNIILIFHW